MQLQPLTNGPLNAIVHALHVPHDIKVAETEHEDSITREYCISRMVTPLRSTAFIVRLAINFDGESHCGSVKIYNRIADGVLSTKSYAELLCSNVLPENYFGSWHVLTEICASVFEVFRVPDDVVPHTPLLLPTIRAHPL